jgi:hypothetical protein
MTNAKHTLTLPDGRELHATYEGDAVGWVAHVSGAQDRPVAGRDLGDVLTDLLEVDGYPDWLVQAINEIAGRDTPLGRRFACPCCGYLTLDEPPAGTYNICEVCCWEDDGVQFRDPDYQGGANGVSLNQARENFRKHGVSEPRFRARARRPLPAEHPLTT